MKLSIASESRLCDRISDLWPTRVTTLFLAQFTEEDNGIFLSLLYYNTSLQLYHAITFPCGTDEASLASMCSLTDSFLDFPIESRCCSCSGTGAESPSNRPDAGLLFCIEGCPLLESSPGLFALVVPALLQIAQKKHIPVMITEW